VSCWLASQSTPIVADGCAPLTKEAASDQHGRGGIGNRGRRTDSVGCWTVSAYLTLTSLAPSNLASLVWYTPRSGLSKYTAEEQHNKEYSAEAGARIASKGHNTVLSCDKN
jgi:hypothetical protein